MIGYATMLRVALEEDFRIGILIVAAGRGEGTHRKDRKFGAERKRGIDTGDKSPLRGQANSEHDKSHRFTDLQR